MQKPLWHFDAEYMTASFIINCFLFLVLVFNQASIYDGAIEFCKICIGIVIYKLVIYLIKTYT
ncbi:hypothetical protein [Rickettsia endosymbiont of Nabis limbatus]|uniref:hypothetical protein n=1 Tax=Rickettsia endosymbiont of Nabis limbatus TaxID=3066268 RepID=UPI003AF399C9